MKYFADDEVFIVSEYAWANAGIDWFSVFGSGKNKYLEISKAFGHFGVVVDQYEQAVGTFEGANAYGASRTVTKVERTMYAVFDEAADYGRDDPGGWITDAVFGKNSSPAVRIAYPLDKAKHLKESMKVAFVVKPKAPYFAEGKEYFTPNLRVPKEITTSIYSFVADIHCVLLMDSTNKVLRVVRAKE